jgi:hypothetical protein
LGNHSGSKALQRPPEAIYGIGQVHQPHTAGMDAKGVRASGVHTRRRLTCFEIPFLFVSVQPLPIKASER